MKIRSVILAAGQGTRMRSELPKVLHPLGGRPMLAYAIEAARQATDGKPIVVIGYGAASIRQAFDGQADFVIQEPQLGTAHALQQAESLLRGKADLVAVSFADMPLLTSETLGRVIHVGQSNRGAISMLTLLADEAHGFGRIIRSAEGKIMGIIEEAHATPEQLHIRELNASVYCFQAEWLWDALKRIPLSPKGEYYLTDAIGMAVQEGIPIHAIQLEDASEAIGINNRLHLAEAETLLRRRINQKWMLNGVTLIDPDATYIEPGVEIGEDTVIWPNSYLLGKTRVGSAVTIGPNTLVRDSSLGDRCQVVSSVLERATLEEEVAVGPYAHLREGAHLARGVHLGNFGEVKNSYLGQGVKMGHFSYIGDAQIGPRVNIGAGTITCNFDGEKKNPTEIGAEAFIGSDTMLVAPVKIGKGARTGAGAVVTKDVPDGTLAVGMPARAVRKLNKDG